MHDQSEPRNPPQPVPSCPGHGSGNGTGHTRMSAEEALQVLGLGPSASAHEVREAYSRLEERLDPRSGGTRYLAATISEARDVLLGV